MPELRAIARIGGETPGPTVIVVGGIHGNEPAGLRAAAAVLEQAKKLPIRGSVFAFAGNMRALAQSKRYLLRDLNREWTAERIAALEKREIADEAEGLELSELRASLEEAIATARGPIYFLDLHTTSAHGIPFAVIADTPRQRGFAAHFPLPVMIGMEEQIDGVLAEYMTLRGCVSLSVEGGQHDDPESQLNLQSVLWVALWAARIAEAEQLPELKASLERLAKARGDLPRMIEVLFRHPVLPEHGFAMEPNFANIQRAHAGQLLARDRRGEIRAPMEGVVLLPLYQALGEDGFFFGRELGPRRERLMDALRSARLDAVLPLLPGIRGGGDRLDLSSGAAQLYPRALFQALGYRRIRTNADGLIYSRRK